MIILPTQTFFNLPDEKRNRIIDAAIDEFSKYSIDNASISRIIKEADIPRGSFYQYFEDILDLYKHIFYIAGEKKVVYLQKAVAEKGENNVFDTIRGLYIGGLEFAEKHPKLTSIGNKFLELDNELKEEIMGGFDQKAQEFFVGILKKGQERGEVRKDIDLKIASFVFVSLNFAIVDSFIKHKDYNEVLSNKKSFMDIVDQVLFIIENGMKAGC